MQAPYGDTTHRWDRYVDRRTCRRTLPSTCRHASQDATSGMCLVLHLRSLLLLFGPEDLGLYTAGCVGELESIAA